jgi:hypothetical protein
VSASAASAPRWPASACRRAARAIALAYDASDRQRRQRDGERRRHRGHPHRGAVAAQPVAHQLARPVAVAAGELTCEVAPKLVGELERAGEAGRRIARHRGAAIASSSAGAPSITDSSGRGGPAASARRSSVGSPRP